jgi:outer membrane protein TolC
LVHTTGFGARSCLVQRERAGEHEAVSIDPEKTYELPELIDIAQRTNPETRVAWERARQAAIAVGLAEGTYYPLLALSATGGAAHLALPFPPNLIPGGLPNGLPDREHPARASHRVARVVAARLRPPQRHRRRCEGAGDGGDGGIQRQAPADRNHGHAGVLCAHRGARQGGRGARGARVSADAGHGGGGAAGTRRGKLPEALQAHEEAARAQYELEDALAAEIDARMALAESMGVLPTTAIRVIDVSQQPLPPGAEESVDDAVDRALAQRPDLLARLAALRAKEAEVREARADFYPKLGVRAATGRNIGRVSILGGPYDTVNAQQWDAGLRFEWTLFEGFERRNRLSLAESAPRVASDELTLARDKAVREVWKAYNDTKVALARQQAGAALLAASEKSWTATLSSYEHGLATYPDVRDAQRNLARARTLDTEARAQVFTSAAALAFSTGDLARPEPAETR